MRLSLGHGINSSSFSSDVELSGIGLEVSFAQVVMMFQEQFTHIESDCGTDESARTACDEIVE